MAPTVTVATAGETVTATYTVVEPGRPVPQTAAYVHPNGSDANPGTLALPRKTPAWGKANGLMGGQHNGASWYPPANTVTDLIALPGATVVLDGAGTKADAIRASGVCNIYGNVIVQNYANTSTANGSSSPVYFGGTSAGSEVDGLTVRNVTKAAIGFQNRVTLRNVLVENCGFSGIMGATADGTLLEDVTVRGVNRGGFTQSGSGGTLGGTKITWSDKVTVRRYNASDGPGAIGLWFDASCTRLAVIDADVDGSAVGGRAQMQHCIQVEKSDGGLYDGTQFYGYVLRPKCRGAEAAGLKVLASGFIKVWGADMHANGWADLWVQQDVSVRGAGAFNPLNRDPSISPWQSVGVELGDSSLDKLWVYDDGRKVWAPKQMLTKVSGLRLATPPVRWGTVSVPLSTVATQLGSAYSAQVLPPPPDVAALLAA